MDNLDTLIKMALEEDIGPGDITAKATIPEGTRARATINAKKALVLAGIASPTMKLVCES